MHGTFELLLLYAGQGNGFEVFAALTDERHILCALVMLGLFGLLLANLPLLSMRIMTPTFVPFLNMLCLTSLMAF